MYARRMAQSWRWRNRCFCCHDSWFCSHFSFSHLFSHESNTWEYHSLLVLSKSSVRILNTWTQFSLTWRLSVVMMSRTWDFMQSLLAEVFWTSQCPLNHEFLPKNISHNFFFRFNMRYKICDKKNSPRPNCVYHFYPGSYTPGKRRFFSFKVI